MGAWDNLSIREKADMMRAAIRNGITTLPEIKQAYNEFAEGGDTVEEWVNAIYQNNPKEKFLGEPEHHYDFTQSKEWADAHGYYPDARGHRDDRVKKPTHPSHPSRGTWEGDKFVLSELGMQNPNYTLFGLNDGGQDSQAVLTYQGGSVIPEITATPNGNYIYNPYDNIRLRYPEGGNIYGSGGQKKSGGSFYQTHRARWFNFLCKKGVNPVKAERLASYFSAQDALESGHGTSSAAKQKNNYGGMQRLDKKTNKMVNVSYGSIDDYMNAKWKMMNNRFGRALNAKSIQEYSNLLNDPKYHGKGYMYALYEGYRDGKPLDVARQTQHMNNYTRILMDIAGEKGFKGAPVPEGVESNDLSIVQPENPYTQFIPFEPFNPQAFNNPQAFVAPTREQFEVEQPIVEAAKDYAYSPEQLEREERRQGLNNLSFILGMMNGGNGSSFADTIGMLTGNIAANGGKIHIKPENRGKFTALKKRTGHSATWFKEHGTPAQRKMATFALNAAKWKHGNGGNLYLFGGENDNNPRPVTTGGAGYIPSNYGQGAIDYVRKTLYDNILPWGYNDIPQRVYNAVVRNKKEEDETRDRAIRDDLFATYLQIPNSERHSIDGGKATLSKSKYKPKGATKDKPTYKFDELTPPAEYGILAYAGQVPGGLNIQGESYLPIGKNRVIYPNDINAFSELEGLGQFTVGRGHDNKGEYISYYDSWDLGNTKNPYKDMSLGIGRSFNIYDRIYLDDYYGVPSPYRGSSYLPEVTVTGKKRRKGRKHGYGGNLYDGTTEDTQQMNIPYAGELPDVTVIPRRIANKAWDKVQERWIGDIPTYYAVNPETGKEEMLREIGNGKYSTYDDRHVFDVLGAEAAKKQKEQWIKNGGNASDFDKVMLGTLGLGLTPIALPEIAAGVSTALANPYVDAGLTSYFGAHGLNHAISEGIDGWGDAVTTALELAPLGRLAKPLYEGIVQPGVRLFNSPLTGNWTTIGNKQYRLSPNSLGANGSSIEQRIPQITAENAVSITPELDAAYKEAVESGNRPEALRLLEQAYLKSGIPRTDVTVTPDGHAVGWYHGSEWGNHTIFDSSAMNATIGGTSAHGKVKGNFLTTDIPSAMRYAGSSRYSSADVPEYTSPQTFSEKVKDLLGVYKPRRLYPAERVGDYAPKPERMFDTKGKPAIDHLDKVDNVVYPLYVNPGEDIMRLDFQGKPWSQSPVEFPNNFYLRRHIRDDIAKTYRDEIVPYKDYETAYKAWIEDPINTRHGSTSLDGMHFGDGIRSIEGFNSAPRYETVRLVEERVPNTTNGAVQTAAKEGKASVLMRNVIDSNGGPEGAHYAIDDFVTLKPNQQKLADITYDDSGNLIPLSQRFNWLKDDIRYGLLPFGIGLTGYGLYNVGNEK